MDKRQPIAGVPPHHGGDEPHLLREMQRERLVRRCADPAEGQRSNVRLSLKGLRLFGEIHDRNHALERSLVSVLGAGEMRAAAGALANLRACIERLH